MRESNYWFSLLNLVHLLGLLVAAGTIVFWDLRLLGIENVEFIYPSQTS